MIKVYREQDRFKANHGWLQSAFSFSFAEYFDPNNLNFGPMCVLNIERRSPINGWGEIEILY
ncbi:cupin domain-containing protein [Priestia abyssalis]|uniref:hypothetical protein n=1 Tax=Priestia abyssalis TaxID=1221450 RepID=UPI00099563B0|nr:hypothetical protein [Priestia abyssalis]